MSYLILGASSGLGRELAYILAKNSNDLIIISRDERDLRAIKSDLEIKFKITVKYFVVDASSFEEIKKFLYSNLNLLSDEVSKIYNKHGFNNSKVISTNFIKYSKQAAKFIIVKNIIVLKNRVEFIFYNSKNF